MATAILVGIVFSVGVVHTAIYFGEAVYWLSYGRVKLPN